MNNTDSIYVRCEPLNDIAEVEHRWLSLEARAEATPFLGWLWIGSWLSLRETWPNAHEVTAWSGERLVGMVLLFERTSLRARYFPVKSLCINEVSDPALDMTIEYNGFLLDVGYEEAASAAMINFIDRHWSTRDEILISGVLATSETYKSLHSSQLQWNTERQSKGRFVDLAALRNRQQPFLVSLSSNKRSQIRRSIRAFEELGHVRCDCAGDIATARAWFDELKEFHKKYWESKGGRGAFSWSERELFYERLLERGFPAGEVDLVKVSAGEAAIGILFNLKKNNGVYYLQSGFNYSLLPKARPGYVTLVLAIQWYAENSADRFDFLAGGEAYKASLADQEYVLLWGAAQRKRTKYKLIDLLRRIKQLLSKPRRSNSDSK